MKRSPLQRYAQIKRKKKYFDGNMYGAVHCSDEHGNQFDSKGEMARYKMLQAFERGGVITNLQLHPKIVLIAKRLRAPEIAWHADYCYVEDGRTIYEDYKPRKSTDREELMFKLWKHFGPGVLHITTHCKNGYKIIKAIMPETNEQLSLFGNDRLHGREWSAAE